jgi:hypothetical protein
MFKTRRRKAITAGLGVLVLAIAAGFLVSRTGTVTGEIRDTAIVLSPDHVGAVVNLELRNVGSSEPCDLIVVLTSLPVDALPVDNGRVITYDGRAIAIGPDGSMPAGLPMVGRPDQINGVTATPGQSVRPGDVARFQVAFDSTPRTDNGWSSVTAWVSTPPAAGPCSPSSDSRIGRAQSAGGFDRRPLHREDTQRVGHRHV